MASTGVRPRSACSVARASADWAVSAAVPWAGRPPRAVTMAWWMLAVGGVPVQHAGGQVAAEGHAGEPVVGLQLADHDGSFPG